MPFDSAPQLDPNTNSPLAVLRSAHAYLAMNRQHWCQNAGRNGIARCAVIAIVNAVEEVPVIRYCNKARNHATRALTATIRQQHLAPDYPCDVCPISLVGYFNDHPATQYADILALFADTITRLEQAQLTGAPHAV